MTVRKYVRSVSYARHPSVALKEGNKKLIFKKCGYSGIDKHMFPKKAIATITGIGGLAGGLGSTMINKGSGLLFDYTKETDMVFMGFKGIEAGYFIIFSICAVCYLIGWTVMKTLVPKYAPITDL